LYAALRELDRSGSDVILVESPPDTLEWRAVRDRLQRAAAGSGAEPEDAT
jgi:L-threonylcarbamoyladenylate synthase